MRIIHSSWHRRTLLGRAPLDPFTTVLTEPHKSVTTEKHGLPLLEARGMVDSKPTADVCQNYAWQLPVTTPKEKAVQLED